MTPLKKRFKALIQIYRDDLDDDKQIDKLVAELLKVAKLDGRGEYYPRSKAELSTPKTKFCEEVFDKRDPALVSCDETFKYAVNLTINYQAEKIMKEAGDKAKAAEMVVSIIMQNNLINGKWANMFEHLRDKMKIRRKADEIAGMIPDPKERLDETKYTVDEYLDLA